MGHWRPDQKKERKVGYGLGFCDLCTEFIGIKPVKNISRRGLERANIIDYRFNEGNNDIRGSNKNKIRRDTNHNKENNLEVGGDGSTTATTGGTGSIFLAGVWTGIEYTRSVNTTTHTNDETVHTVDVIGSNSGIDEGSNSDMEDSYFVVDDEYIPNLHKEEDKRDFMSKDPEMVILGGGGR